MKQRENANKTQLFKNNKGSAIVMVLVIIAFISILVSVLYYRAVLNYQMKVVDHKSKDNFYTAESALDEVRVGLQSIASDAVAESYVEVMQKYDQNDNQGRADDFSFLYRQKLTNALNDGGNEELYDVDILKGYLTNPYNVATGVGAELKASDNDDSTSDDNVMLSYSNALVLQNVQVTYTDADGFVSIIKTDIQINLPAVDFNEAFRIPDILDYCVIANDSLEVDAGTPYVKGSIYAGKNGIQLKNSTTLRIQEAELVVTDGAINAESGTKLEVQSSESNTWAKDIVLDSATADIKGNIYVADDTSINGKKSSLTYNGAYYGFGDSITTGSDGSSAILINGLDTKINFADLKTLTLAGNAYINIKDEADKVVLNVGAGDDTLQKPAEDSGLTNPINSTHNIMMGESLSVKSNQLAYLVPAECIGYKGDTCILGSNPVTQDRLEAYIAQRDSELSEVEKAQYKEVNMDMISTLGQSLNTLNAKVQKLYHPVAGTDTVLVYYYMVFNDEESANYFFRQYYANNKSKMDSYIRNYIDEENSNFGDFTSMDINLAGNLLRQEGSGDTAEYVLQEDTYQASNSDQDYLNSVDYYQQTYEALYTKLSKDFDSLTTEEKTNKSTEGIFANIIDQGKLSAIPSDFYTGNVAAFGDTTDMSADNNLAIVVNNTTAETDQYHISSLSYINNVRIIVATGNIVVDTNFNGIIIAKGKITVKSGCGQINEDSEAVAKAMQLSRTFVDMSGTETSYPFIELFKDGQALAVDRSEGSGGDSDHVEVEGLIGYRNWNKQ